jgi:hypothetical protein
MINYESIIIKNTIRARIYSPTLNNCHKKSQYPIVVRVLLHIFPENEIKFEYLFQTRRLRTIKQYLIL